MQIETSLLALPGIGTVTPTFLCALVAMSARNGWDPNGIALVISEESLFNPAAKNPHSSASGLIQFIDSTAASLGTTTAQIRTMTAEQQLPLVERFFQTSLNGRVPARIEDYFLSVLGHPDLIGKPDDTPVFVRGSGGYAGNPQIDIGGDGIITVGDTRAYMQRVLRQAKGTIGSYPSICYENVTSPSTRSNGALAAFALGTIMAAVGYGTYKLLGALKPKPAPALPPPVFRRFGAPR